MPLIETRGAGSAQGFGEFAQSAAVNYIEDVFSTYLYTGNNPSTQSIVNGIDLAGKGGLVWVKSRSSPDATNYNHILMDTARGTGTGNILYGNLTNAAVTAANAGISSFNSNGFSLRYDDGYGTNYPSGNSLVSWTFREQKKFFDVVTYTGDGQNDRQISHNLGSTPGCIIVKSLYMTGAGGPANWSVYHRSISPSQSLFLNTTAAAATNDGLFGTPTSTYFVVNQPGGGNTLNANGDQYVAYLFAHDAGGFGLSGSDNVISCGSLTTDANGYFTVNLGYEPQWVMMKGSSTTSPWYMVDNMRGWTNGSGGDAQLSANNSNAESTGGFANITSTGFANPDVGFVGNATYIYIAIRRGPMKTPTSGTSVFSPNKTNASSGTIVTTDVNSDLFVVKYLDGVDIPRWHDRLRGYANNVGDASPLLRSSGTDAELTGATGAIASVTNTGFKVTGTLGGLNSVYYSFRRAPGFFDEVCYTGNGIGQTIYHNLGVVPEMMIFKTRTGATRNWGVYVASIGTGKKLWLNATNAVQNDASFVPSTPTASILNQGNADETDEGGNTYVAYLFATVAGVSKVGSYTGSGTTKQIDCGFTGGARFVLIKRTDSTGDWYVWDTARGIVSGNDPYLLLNSTAAEVTNTDYIDTYSAGFELSSTAPAALNANGGTYIFLAIA